MSTKTSVAVIGQGFVGGSLTTVMAEKGFDVYVFDKAGKLAPGGKNSTPGTFQGKPVSSIEDLVIACEHPNVKGFTNVYFVCVPTPMREDGAADLSIVEGVLQILSKLPGQRVAVVKSTVPPGSTEQWNKMFKDTGLTVIFNPEFLREASAIDDMRNQNRIILGGPRPWINKVKEIYQRGWPDVPIKKTSSTTAEMVKYVTNIHLATKVALANEFYQICSALDEKGANIDYDKVIEYALFDERLGKSHWQVPGPMPADDSGKPAFGFGGSCFVKDLNALMVVAKQLDVDPKIMSAAWNKNLEVRPQRDWENLIGRAVSTRKK